MRRTRRLCSRVIRYSEYIENVHGESLSRGNFEGLRETRSDCIAYDYKAAIEESEGARTREIGRKNFHLDCRARRHSVYLADVSHAFLCIVPFLPIIG